MDFARRSTHNPILKPSDIKPSTEGMKIECLLNPGVFRFENKIWLLLRVAERPEQEAGQVSFPVLKADGIEILHFSVDDPNLDTTDPRIINPTVLRESPKMIMGILPKRSIKYPSTGLQDTATIIWTPKAVPPRAVA